MALRMLVLATKFALLITCFQLIQPFAFLDFNSGPQFTTFIQATQLSSGDLILIHDNNFWLLDLSDLSQTLYFAPSLEAGAIIGDVMLSPDRRYLYYLVFNEDKPDTASQFVQFDTAAQATKVLFEREGLGRMTPISPDGRRVILTYQASSDMLGVLSHCLLDVESGNCPDIDLHFDQNNVFWLDNNSLISPLLNRIEKYSVISNSTLGQHSISEESWWFGPATMSADQKTLIVEVTVRSETSYVQKLMPVDTATLEIGEPIYEVADSVDAAISHIQLSPNGIFLTYQAGLTLKVLDMTTEEEVLEITNVLRSTWANNETIIAVRDLPLEFETLASIDLSTRTISQSSQLPSETYLVTVP
jgi:hypothetical protein